MTTTRIGEDILDSRDLLEREQELRSEAITALELERDDIDEVLDEDDEVALEDILRNGWTSILAQLLPFDCDELVSLIALNEEGDAMFGSEWSYGVTLVRDRYFADYAQQLAEDIAPSMEARDMMDQWPFYHIDWEAAADSLKVDYSSIDIDGVEYWGRA